MGERMFIATILLTVLGLVIALINLCYPIHKTERKLTGWKNLTKSGWKNLTGWGKAVVALSVVVGIVSAWSAWQEVLAQGQLKDSDITLQLTAWKADEPSATDLEYHTPPSIEIGLVVPSEADWTCFLEPLPGFVYSGPSRGASARQRVYITKLTNSTGTHPKYVWNLDGKKVLILRSPKYAFWGADNSWHVEVILDIRGHQFRPIDEAAHQLEFDLKDLGFWRVLPSLR